MKDERERVKLLKRLQAAQFAAWEIHLFLDTHPKDEMALESFRKYTERYKELMKEYNECFGPITADKSMCEKEWDWVNNPWPWDKPECDN